MNKDYNEQDAKALIKFDWVKELYGYALKSGFQGDLEYFVFWEWDDLLRRWND